MGCQIKQPHPKKRNMYLYVTESSDCAVVRKWGNSLAVPVHLKTCEEDEDRIDSGARDPDHQRVHAHAQGAKRLSPPRPV
ncbi:unnamed protein product [Periconia digitata]|uniref:Uncharacterized protein n=1 Tax=Periconia digitata TaxID=1303443 RepID=A0A9W4UW68_9PLEO|nr:unnamed protein product [Periconia digitata]